MYPGYDETDYYIRFKNMLSKFPDLNLFFNIWKLFQNSFTAPQRFLEIQSGSMKL